MHTILLSVDVTCAHPPGPLEAVQIKMHTPGLTDSEVNTLRFLLSVDASMTKGASVNFG